MELPVSYLTELTTLEQAIADNEYDGRPFGYAEDDWRRLLAKMRDGDELRNFAPPNRGVIQILGMALVRYVRVISTVITAVD